MKDIKEIKFEELTTKQKLGFVTIATVHERITDEQLRELREAIDLQEFYSPKHDAERINGMDSKFHLLIYRFSGSGPLYDTLTPLHKKVMKYRHASVANEVRSVDSYQEHRAIFDAIAAHDSDLAEERMRAHIANAKAFIQNKSSD